uniref:AP2/ERF domain-containing protein n=1 Tax=Steinernema glaseri TaxID=37863 RepID=A0A1I7ZC19_9BILA
MVLSCALRVFLTMSDNNNGEDEAGKDKGKKTGEFFGKTGGRVLDEKTGEYWIKTKRMIAEEKGEVYWETETESESTTTFDSSISSDSSGSVFRLRRDPRVWCSREQMRAKAFKQEPELVTEHRMFTGAEWLEFTRANPQQSEPTQRRTYGDIYGNLARAYGLRIGPYWTPPPSETSTESEEDSSNKKKVRR